MTFLVSFLALLIERFFDWSHVRQWRWYKKYQHYIISVLPVKNPFVALILVVLPLVLLIGFFQYLLKGWLYGFIPLLFNLFVLIYCLGPKNLWADIFSCMNALVQADQSFAEEQLQKIFGSSLPLAESFHHDLLDLIFIEVNKRIFAVIFWFIVLGPLGAVLYRTVNLLVKEPQESEISDLSQKALFLQNILDWLPARILTFIFALSGQFVQVFLCWRQKVLQGLDSNNEILTQCGKAALGLFEEIPEDGSAEKNAIGLIDRSLIIFLVLIALTTFLI